MSTRSIILAVVFIIGNTLQSDAQGTYISGNTQVTPGTQEYYEAHFEYGLNPYTNVSWSVSGGTIIQQGINPTMTVYCIVEWGQTPGGGFVSVYEDLGSQYAELPVTIGSPEISPASQNVSYGSIPTSLCASFGGADIFSYDWEESNDGINWTYISSAVGCYQPPIAYQTKYYRCLLLVAGGYFYTPVASVTIPTLDPGIISASNLQPNFNTSITISNTPATWGLCFTSSYQYTWEYAFEGGSWTVVGTGQNYPASSVLVNGRILIRRKIVCGSETAYSNTLVIDPAYTPVDWENKNYVREISVIKKGITSYFQAAATGGRQTSIHNIPGWYGKTHTNGEPRRRTI